MVKSTGSREGSTRHATCVRKLTIRPENTANDAPGKTRSAKAHVGLDCPPPLAPPPDTAVNLSGYIRSLTAADNSRELRDGASENHSGGECPGGSLRCGDSLAGAQGGVESAETRRACEAIQRAGRAGGLGGSIPARLDVLLRPRSVTELHRGGAWYRISAGYGIANGQYALGYCWRRARWLPWALLSVSLAGYAVHSVSGSCWTGWLRPLAVVLPAVVSGACAVIAVGSATQERTQSTDKAEPPTTREGSRGKTGC